MTLKDLLEKRAEKDGEKPFVFFQGQEIPFSGLNQKVNQVARALKELGIGKGDLVCLFLPNCLEFLYVWFGLAKIGGVMVPLPLHLRRDELTYILHHCDARTLVVDERLYPRYAALEKDGPAIRHRIWVGKKAPPSADYISWENILEGSGEDSPPATDVKEGDLLGILYTSREGVLPQGVMISQGNYTHSGQIWARDIIGYQKEDVFLTTFPLSGANAQMLTVMGSLVSGCPCVLKEQFSPSWFFGEIRQHRATIFNSNREMLSQLLKLPEREEDSIHPARATYGGAVSAQMKQTFEKRFGIKILSGYGPIENGGICLVHPPENQKKGSIGKARPGCEVLIWDEKNREVPLGQTGEIVVRGNHPQSQFLGYYKQLDKTAEALDGGAFHTGDWGYRDEDGYFYLVDSSDHHGERIFFDEGVWGPGRCSEGRKSF